MGQQPATAAIVVGCIVGGAALLFVSYKIYVRVYHSRQRNQNALPATREPQNYASQYLTPSTNAMAGTLYGDSTYKDSWRGSSHQSKASLSSHLERAYGSEVSYPYHERRTSSQGLLTPSALTNVESLTGSPPLSPDGDLPSLPLATTPPPSNTPPQHGKHLSSSSSTMTLKRSYAPSVKASGGMSTSTPTYRRDSYLPHLPENRDQIQIVPPQPLGFGLGGMATALDQKTLAFSSTSGIGNNDEDFSRGLIWHEGNPEAAAHQRVSRLGEDERLRYLAQGPRALSPSTRGAIHNHIYAGSNAGSSGVRTPDVPSSRSRSPAHVAPWDGSSSSDVGPSVSQRGTISPSQLPLQYVSHPLEASPSNHSNYSNNARITAPFTNQQSPLAMMSGAAHDGSSSAIRPFATPSPQKDINSSSPIMSALRNPITSNANDRQAEFTSHSHSNSQNSGSAASGYNTGERTPGLISASVSTENGSGSVPLTDGSERQSPVEYRPGALEKTSEVPLDSFAIDEEKKIAIGKNGQLQMVGASQQPPIEASGNGADKRQSKGFLFGRFIGGGKA